MAYILKKDSDAVYQCGCFSGSEADLRQYIANGDAQYKRTRMIALRACKILLGVSK